MTTEQWTRIWDLLDRALDRPPDERMDWLDTVCADAPTVRAEVESLIKAYDPTDPLFNEAEIAPPHWFADDISDPSSPAESAVRPEPGTLVGAYRLVEEIGVGGMSVVYRAERDDDAVDHTVAVKLMHRRLSAHDAEQRFRAERQVLASLNHPNIAQFIDGGVTEKGRPYLVMEYVDGCPITDYADDRDLDLKARLDLLDQVFDAVQAAHRQLVVHRDLKPSNVLVADTKNGPQVTLVDFGIAKLLDNSLPVPVPQTRTGHRLLTPSYAAPEQLGEEDVSTVTDVYQIGVLAYELLTGGRPFDLVDKRPSEIETIVRTRSPTDPSEVAPPARASQLRGDLDQIVQTALRKEPDRRYASVEALATDVGRYRRGEPIDAQPATLGYRARKFVNRNWMGVSVASTFLLMLALFIGLLVRQQRITAAERDRAQQEAETAEQVSAFLASLFEANQPSEARGDTLTAPELLDRGVQRAETLDEQPVVQAHMFREMAAAYRSMGDYDQAESLARKAQTVRSTTSLETADGLYELGLVLEEQGKYAAADSVYRKALSIRRDRLGPRHPKVGTTLNDLGIVLRQMGDYTAADSVHRNALDIQRSHFGSRHLKVATTLNDLGIVLRKRGEYPAADSVFRTALSIRRENLGPRHPDVAVSLHNLASVMKDRGKFAAADSMFRKVLSIEREQLGPRHPTLATTLNNLGIVLKAKDEYAAAESTYRKALSIRREKLGPRHPKVATTLNNLGVVLRQRTRYAAADSVYRTALSIRREKLGPRHPRVAATLNNLGVVLRQRPRYAAADSVYRTALSIRRENLGPRHPKVATTLNNLGIVRNAKGEYAAADSTYRKALSIQREQLGLEHPHTANTMSNLGTTLTYRDEFDAADSLLTQSLRLRRRIHGDADLSVAESYEDLALLRREQQRYRTAERHFQRALDIRQAELSADHPSVQESVRHLAELYETWKKPAQAKQYRATLHQHDGATTP